MLEYCGDIQVPSEEGCHAPKVPTLQARFSGPLEQHKNDQEVFRKIRQRLSNAERIQARIEQLIKMPLHDFWKAELGGQR